MVFRFYFLIFCSSFLWETFPDSGLICHELSILIFEKLLKIIFLTWRYITVSLIDHHLWIFTIMYRLFRQSKHLSTSFISIPALSIPQPNTSYMEANKPCNSGSFIRQYMQFLSHSRRSHSRRGKNSILLLFLKYKIWIIKLLSLSNPFLPNQLLTIQ